MTTRMIGTGGKSLEAMRALAPQQPGIEVLPSTVNEAAIRKEITVSPLFGYEYMAALSRNRYTAQRAEMQLQEPNADYALITSDTGVLVEINGKHVAVPSNVRPGDEHIYLDEINRKGAVTLIGAVTFGRKQGESMMTSLTYYDIPLGQPLTHMPENPQDLLALKDPGKNARIGYIEPVAGDKGEVKFEKSTVDIFPIMPDQEHENSQRYITGLTEAVVNLAGKTAAFDREVAPVMEQAVADHPFNTLAFYSQFNQSGEPDLLSYYRKMVEHPEDHFNRFGGNCTLFVLDMERRLREQGYQSRVAVFTSDTPSHPQGHGALYTESDDVSYFIDPGLTFTYPIPIPKDVPLFPSVFRGNKVVLLEVADMNEDGLPDLIILKNGKKIVLPGKQMMDVDQFRAIMPQVLVDLHDIRTKLKLDFHSRHGDKKGSVQVDGKTNDVSFCANGSEPVSYPLAEVLGNSTLQGELGAMYSNQEIDFGPILGQLQGFAAV